MKIVFRAWTAGLFEGEGTARFNGTSLYASLATTDKDIAQELQKHAGGAIYRLARRPKRKQVYWWQLCGREAFLFLAELLPLLGKRRTQQVVAAMRRWYQQVVIKGRYTKYKQDRRLAKLVREISR